MAKKFKDIIDVDKIPTEEEKTAAAQMLESITSNKKKQIRLAVRMDEELLEDFKKINQELSINSSNLVRSWVASYVSDHRDLLDK